MSKALLNGVEINYRCLGEGSDDVVLIHGLAANLAFWPPPLLLSLARRFRLTVYDLRGHGLSEMSPSGYTRSEMAHDLESLLDHLQVERADLVGHSYGGAVALHFAVARPDRVRSLTLIDTRLRELQPHQRLIDWDDWREAKRELDELGIEVDENAEEIGLLLLAKIASPEWRERRRQYAGRMDFVPFEGGLPSQRAADRWVRLLEETSAWNDFQNGDLLALEELRGLLKPVLGLYGELSRCRRTAERLPEVWPGCRVHVVPEVGHFLPASRPDLVAERVVAFLEETGQHQLDGRSLHRITASPTSDTR